MAFYFSDFSYYEDKNTTRIQLKDRHHCIHSENACGSSTAIIIFRTLRLWHVMFEPGGAGLPRPRFYGVFVRARAGPGEAWNRGYGETNPQTVFPRISSVHFPRAHARIRQVSRRAKSKKGTQRCTHKNWETPGKSVELATLKSLVLFIIMACVYV